MRHGWAALALVLGLTALTPRQVIAQQSGTPQQPAPPRAKAAGGLGQNYPNPFNPETRIPFTVGDYPTCAEPSRPHKVTLRIYNLLAQLVAVPVLQGGAGNVAGGAAIENLALTCSQYTAYWDGKDRRSGREVASGIYLYRLEIDGKAIVKKMIVAK
jgi:hypothetical protein